MTDNIKVLIADDHQLFADGLRSMLSSAKTIDVIGVASDGSEVIRKLQSQYVDIVLLDIQMPNTDGITTAEYLRDKHPEVKVIVVSMFGERTFIERMYRIGVAGYLLKNTTLDELLLAIETVHSGKKFFAHDLNAEILGGAKDASSTTTMPLSKREVEIISLVAKGFNNAEVATALHLSPLTVGTHRKNIMQKLNVNNTASLVRYAMLNGLTD